MNSVSRRSTYLRAQVGVLRNPIRTCIRVAAERAS